MLLSIVMTLLPGLLTSVIALLAGIFLQRMANRYNKQKEIRVMIENIYRNKSIK
jgi:ABC-type phosphate transport system permease subunit